MGRLIAGIGFAPMIKGVCEVCISSPTKLKNLPLLLHDVGCERLHDVFLGSSSEGLR
jgi:hypothetical protein